MRREVTNYFRRDGFPRPGRIWPWDTGLCKCVLTYFEIVESCRLCGGAGIVGERRIRGTSQEGTDDPMGYGQMLVELPTRKRVAVERWFMHAELGILVPKRRWMQIEAGWKTRYLRDEGRSMAYLNNAHRLAEYYIRIKQRRTPTAQLIQVFQENLDSGLRAMALRYGRKLFERLT